MLTEIGGGTWQWPARPALVLETMMVAAGVRASIHRIPLGRLLRFIDRLDVRQPALDRSADDARKEREAARAAARAVRSVGKHVFRKSICLSEAITLRLLLRRKGIDVRIRIGLSRDADDDLRAHAWVEHDGDILIGGEESSRLFATTFYLERETR